MVTIENKRLRVTVSDEIWRAFGARAAQLEHTQVLPSGERREHDIVAIQRGLVLSEAMRKLGNRAEYTQLQQDEPDLGAIHALAKSMLMERYLAEHGRYDANETMMRHNSGRIMPEGMQRDVQKALAYADGLLQPLSDEQALTALRQYVIACHTEGREVPERDFHHQIALVTLRKGGLDDAAAVVAEAAQAVALVKQMEVSYRQSHACMDGWQIEIIGEMPTQIGLCRMPS